MDTPSNTLSSKHDNGFYEPFDAEVVTTEIFEHENFGMHYKSIGEFGGATKLGVCLETLLPGKQANQAHFHLAEEEHIYILEGELTLRLGKNHYTMTPGSYVCFPAGQEVEHAIFNHSAENCRYLIFSNRDENDVAVYPDTNKIRIRRTGESFVRDTVVDYWHGES